MRFAAKILLLILLLAMGASGARYATETALRNPHVLYLVMQFELMRGNPEAALRVFKKAARPVPSLAGIHASVVDGCEADAGI